MKEWRVTYSFLGTEFKVLGDYEDRSAAEKSIEEWKYSKLHQTTLIVYGEQALNGQNTGNYSLTDVTMAYNVTLTCLT